MQTVAVFIATGNSIKTAKLKVSQSRGTNIKIIGKK